MDFFICTNEELIKKERKNTTESEDASALISSKTKPDSPMKVEIENDDEEKNLDEKKAEENLEENSEEKKSEENSEEKKSEENPEEKNSEENPEEKKDSENPEEKIEEESKKNSEEQIPEEIDGQKIELLDYLLNFLDTEEPLNHVLAGYFSKFFIQLLNKNQKVILSYIYSRRPEILERFIQHIEMRSICDCIPKLILPESSYSENQTSNLFTGIENFEKIRNQIVRNLFLKIDLSCNMETINNINNACIEILENKNILEFVLSDEIIIKHIFTNLSINLNLEENSELSSYNYKEVMILLLNILRNSIIENLYVPKEENKSYVEGLNLASDADKENNSKEEKRDLKCSFLGEMILEYLMKILDNFIIGDVPSSIVETTYSVSTRVLGIKRYLRNDLLKFFLFLIFLFFIFFIFNYLIF